MRRTRDGRCSAPTSGGWSALQVDAWWEEPPTTTSSTSTGENPASTERVGKGPPFGTLLGWWQTIIVVGGEKTLNIF